MTLEDLLMELVKEGKAVRMPIGKAAIQPDKAEANKEQGALKLDKPQAVPAIIHIENLHIHLDERMTSLIIPSSPDDKSEDKEERGTSGYRCRRDACPDQAEYRSVHEEHPCRS